MSRKIVIILLAVSALSLAILGLVVYLQTAGAFLLTLVLLPFVLTLSALVFLLFTMKPGNANSRKSENSPVDGLLRAVPEILLLVDANGRILKKNVAADRLLRGSQLPPDLLEIVRNSWPANGETETEPGNRPYHTDTPLGEASYDVRVIPQDSSSNALVLLHDRRTDKELADLVATLSHQVKTPLTAIRLALSLLEKNGTRLSPQQAELVQTALEETDKLGLNVDDLLDLTEVEVGADVLQLERVDPAELLQDVADRLSRVAAQREIRIEVANHGQPRGIAMDRERIQSVVESLVLNALRHSPRGSRVILDTGFDSVRQTAIISVQDHSIWLDSHKMLQVMDRFLTQQVNHSLPSTNDPRESLSLDEARSLTEQTSCEDALGFFVARQIVRAHNGALKIFCRRKDGCDVEIHLPLQRDKPPAAELPPLTEEQMDNPYIRPLTRRFWGRITPNL